MSKGFFLSLILHGAVIYALIYGLPNIGREIQDMEVPISFDVIAAETLTTKPAPKRAEVKPQPKPEPKPKPIHKPIVKPEEKPEEVAKEEVEKEKTPEPVEKPKVLEEPPKVAPLPDTKPEEEKVEEVPDRVTPIPQVKPKLKAPELQVKKKEEERFTSVLKDLKKLKEKTQVKGQDEKAQETEDEGDVGKLGEELTISEIDAVRSQLSKCWNVPAGARDAKDLKVKIHLWMNADGSVNKAKIIKDLFLQNHPFYKVAADRALNAVLDKNCNPLPLPMKKYDLWKEMIITFDPKDMLG